MKLPSLNRLISSNGRGSVLVIAALLIGSATIRLVAGAGSVLAQDGSAQVDTPDPAEPMASQEMASAETGPAPSPLDMAANRDEISNLITALTEREAQVSKREKQLEMRMRALEVADAEIEKRLEALAQTESALRATLALADEASEKDVARLTTVYENMKPKEAATLFEQMEPSFAAGFLGRMRPDAAADIMAGLTPEVAYSISVILAGRNALVPKT